MLNAFIFSRLLGLVGDKLLLFAVPVGIYATTRDVKLSGIVTIAQWLPRIALLPFLGGLLDRFALRKQLIFVEILRTGLSIGLIVDTSRTHVLLTAGVLSILNGCCYIGLESVTAQLGRPDERAALQARVQATDRLSRLLGPALGGVLLASPFRHAPYCCATLLFAGSLVTLWVRFRSQAGPSRDHRSGIAADAVKSFAHIFSTPPLLLLTTIMLVGNLLESTLLTLLPAFVLTQFHGTSSDIAALEVCTAIATILLLSLMPRLTRAGYLSLESAYPWAIAAMYGAPVLGVLSGNLFAFGCAYTTFFAAQSISTIYIRVKRLPLIPKERFSATMGSLIALVQSTIPLGGAIVFAASRHTTPGPLVACIAGFSLAISALCKVVLNRVVVAPAAV